MKILRRRRFPHDPSRAQGPARAHGHTVVEANDGKEALQMYRQDRPGLVLIDVVMPVMDGYEIRAAHAR